MVSKKWRKLLGGAATLSIVLASGLFALPASAEEPAQAPAPQEAMMPAAPVDEHMPPEIAAMEEPGDYEMGQLLFTGQKRFTNGGPPCMSCHNASVGALGGGCLGPDLTRTYADPSKNPLINAVWINNPGTPVMGPVFSRKPVTDEEAAHLRAFFRAQCKGEVAPVKYSTFGGIGVAGTIGILIVFSIIWSGRYRNRCKGTAHDALWRNYGGKGGR